MAGAAVAGTVALADGGNGIREELTGYQEDPLTLSTTGSGDFHASIQAKGDAIWYRLSYSGPRGRRSSRPTSTSGAARRAAASPSSSAPTSATGRPARRPARPAPATITGTIKPADVIGPAAQGIAAGEFDELLDAIDGGVTYVNVHSAAYPGGEIRAQLEPTHDG